MLFVFTEKLKGRCTQKAFTGVVHVLHAARIGDAQRNPRSDNSSCQNYQYYVWLWSKEATVFNTLAQEAMLVSLSPNKTLLTLILMLVAGRTTI